MSIAPINGGQALPPLAEIRGIDEGPKGVAKADPAEEFGKALMDARQHENAATDAAERFAHGDPGMGIHEVMIASEKANVAVRYATTLKNKAVEAYRELMNTQV